MTENEIADRQQLQAAITDSNKYLNIKWGNRRLIVTYKVDKLKQNLRFSQNYKLTTDHQ